jgi:hypothetical protein
MLCIGNPYGVELRYKLNLIKQLDLQHLDVPRNKISYCLRAFWSHRLSVVATHLDGSWKTPPQRDLHISANIYPLFTFFHRTIPSDYSIGLFHRTIAYDIDVHIYRYYMIHSNVRKNYKHMDIMSPFLW